MFEFSWLLMCLVLLLAFMFAYLLVSATVLCLHITDTFCQKNTYICTLSLVWIMVTHAKTCT